MDIKKLFGYEGRNVVVTGAFSGMGLAAARLLNELGANVYAVCRRNGRHDTLDFPVTKILYADFALKEDIEALASEMPDDIEALFLCHGIAQKPDGSNVLEVQKVNFLGHKYLLKLVARKICNNGSVSIISSAGGFGWEETYKDCYDLIMTSSYEDALRWYENNLIRVANPELGGIGYSFSKQCLDAYIKTMVHDPLFIKRKIRLNAINPGNTETGLTDEFNLMSSSTGDDPEEGREVLEAMFQESWNGRWASAEEMGYPLVAIGSKMFSYMSGQVIYFDYGMSSVWEIDDLQDKF